MTFICYIDRTNSDTPHMEPLSALTLPDAEAEARALLLFYESGTAARIYAENDLVATVSPDPSGLTRTGNQSSAVQTKP